MTVARKKERETCCLAVTGINTMYFQQFLQQCVYRRCALCIYSV